MKMKKAIKTVVSITLVILVLLLTGCGGGFNSDNGNAKEFLNPLFKKGDTATAVNDHPGG